MLHNAPDYPHRRWLRQTLINLRLVSACIFQNLLAAKTVICKLRAKANGPEFEMKLYKVHTIQSLPIPLEQAWDFFANPRNLAKITPPWLNLKPVFEVPAAMYPGMIITYRVKPFAGIGVNWVTEITHVSEPRFFVDEQRFGPYKFWHHQHHFREIPGGVEVQDLIHYALPFGIFGRVAHVLSVRRQLNRIFEYRQSLLEEMFGRLD